MCPPYILIFTEIVFKPWLMQFSTLAKVFSQAVFYLWILNVVSSNYSYLSQLVKVFFSFQSSFGDKLHDLVIHLFTGFEIANLIFNLLFALNDSSSLYTFSGQLAVLQLYFLSYSSCMFPNMESCLTLHIYIYVYFLRYK